MSICYHCLATEKEKKKARKQGERALSKCVFTLLAQRDALIQELLDAPCRVRMHARGICLHVRSGGVRLLAVVEHRLQDTLGDGFSVLVRASWLLREALPHSCSVAAQARCNATRPDTP